MTDTQFEHEVFPKELAYVRQRRGLALGEPTDAEGDPSGYEGRGRDPRERLVGLALSGGGIRSAVFSLGVMQALDRRGVFRFFDYLSTVSGGGYIGASLSSLMAREREKGGARAAFPFRAPPPGEPEPEPLSHLRNNSNYLAPRGVMDVLSGVAALMRGILLNSLSLFPYLLAVCLVVLLLYGQQLADRARWDDQVESIDHLLLRYDGDRLESDPERQAAPVLDILEAEALLREDQARDRNDLVHKLRGDLSLTAADGRGEGTPVALITGNGTAAAPFLFAPGMDRKALARALLAADVLQRFEVVEEVDLLTRLIEEGASGIPRWRMSRPRPRRPGAPAMERPITPPAPAIRWRIWWGGFAQIAWCARGRPTSSSTASCWHRASRSAPAPASSGPAARA